MSATEYIHPDWVDGYNRFLGLFSRRRDEQDYLLPPGDVLIYQGSESGAPAREMGTRDNDYRFHPVIGATVEDKKGRLWTITRYTDYHGQGDYGSWMKMTRVYAKRVDE